MNKQTGRKTHLLLNLLPIFIVLAVALGCTFSTNPPTAGNTPANPPAANTNQPANTPAVKNTPDSSNTSDTKADNPASVFYGTWEKEEPGQPFRYEKFGTAEKKGDNYVGKVTDQSNTVVATYTVFPDKTVEISYLPAYYGGSSFTYGYTVSDSGNKLTFDSKPPIVYTKGTTKTNIQKDVTFFVAHPWYSAKDPLRELSFSNEQQSDKGWGGNYTFTYNGNPNEDGTFLITEAGKITFTASRGGSTAYTYKIRGEMFDFTRDRDGDTDTFSK